MLRRIASSGEKIMPAHHGMSLRAALADARSNGCQVRTARRTGEVVIQSPGEKRVRVNCRRKDAPRSLTKFLIRIDSDQRKEGHVMDEQPIAAVVPIPPKVQTPPPAPPVAKPEIISQIEALHELRESVKVGAREELDRLERDRADILAMLSDNDTRVASITSEFPEFAASKMVPECDQLRRLRGFLGSRPHVWIPAAEIARACELPGRVAPHIRPMLKAGEVQRSGQRRATKYMYLGNGEFK